jgi:hypothetical protein
MGIGVLANGVPTGWVSSRSNRWAVDMLRGYGD